jgi:hypothetical protein
MNRIASMSLALFLLPTAAYGQFSIDWYTIDGGGGVSSGGTFELQGTIGQHDAGTPHTGGSFGLAGGFWAVSPPGAGCYPDCDSSTGQGILDIFDFLCFQNGFAAGAPYACECDVSTGPGVCDIFDFLCFQNAFAAGCP